MQVYCGTDIIEVDRIKEALQTTKGFKEKIYTEYEIQEIDKITSDIKYQKYAGRFAAKEAIYKAMSKILTENGISMSFFDVEIRNLEELKRRPKVIILNENIINFLKKYEFDIDVSISHINSNAIAMAVVKIEGDD